MCGNEAVSVGALVAGHRYAMQRRRPPSAIDAALRGEKKHGALRREACVPGRVRLQQERVARVPNTNTQNTRVDHFFPVSHQFMRMQVRRIETLGPQLCSGADV